MVTEEPKRELRIAFDWRQKRSMHRLRSPSVNLGHMDTGVPWWTPGTLVMRYMRMRPCSSPPAVEARPLLPRRSRAPPEPDPACESNRIDLVDPPGQEGPEGRAPSEGEPGTRGAPGKRTQHGAQDKPSSGAMRRARTWGAREKRSPMVPRGKGPKTEPGTSRAGWGGSSGEDPARQGGEGGPGRRGRGPPGALVKPEPAGLWTPDWFADRGGGEPWRTVVLQWWSL